MLFGLAVVADRQEQLAGDFELITFAGKEHGPAGHFFTRNNQ
ncbi:MAG: hypothetical protein ACI81P_000665 [Neolewinella sp.]|jgi:hypothetical protein